MGMLEILKGKSIKGYENEFFRKISAELFELFQRKSWDGILIGMPECITKEELQIDCLLFTKNQIIIIDFKKYKGVLKLPSSNKFNSGKWILNNDVIVRGGSRRNPFVQLQKQRERLVQELQSRFHTFDKRTISTMVCFQDKVVTVGDIPPTYQLSFSIVDPTNYLNKIVDIIDVIGSERVDYLSPLGRNILTKTVFQANPYRFNETIDEVILAPVVESTNNKPEVNKISDFLRSDQKIMTLTGNTKSGKTSLIPFIRDLAFDLNYTHVPVFAFSNRLKQKMLQSHPYLEEVESLFSSIFDFSTEIRDKNYKKVIPLKISSPLSTEEDPTGDDIVIPDKTLYIIDDSQLITNSKFSSEDIQYGSGHLLNDLLDHINLEKRPDTKIIFVGDINKLSFGSDTEDALQISYLESLLKQRNLISDVVHIDLPNSKSENEIIKTCNHIATQIKQDQYSSLVLSSQNEISINEIENKAIVMKSAFEHPHSKKILVYTNKTAMKINQWIKHHILENNSQLGTGDLLLFNSPSLAIQKSINDINVSQNHDRRNTEHILTEIRQVHNGMFGEVIEINLKNVIEKIEIIEEQKITLRFIPCCVRLRDGSMIETYIFENFLNAEKNELEQNEQIAYHKVLSRLEAKAQETNPFSQSFEFVEMLKHPEKYTKINRDGKVIYRNPSDARKLTSYEKAYRNRILKELNNPNFEYFKILNAAKVKFGWAMTVNKAMAYTFDEVFFITDEESRGRTNKEYFKWLYTGISTTLNKVYLINWKPISPFMKINFSDAPIVINSKKKNQNVFSFADDEVQPAEHLRTYLNNHLSGVGTIENIVSRPYLEMVTLKIDSENVEVFFDYTGKREMKNPRFKTGSQIGYEKLLSLLTPESKDLLNELGVMKPVFKELSQNLQSAEISLRIIDAQDWKIIFQLRKDGEHVEIQTYYDGKGMLSTFDYLNGSIEIFKQAVELIQEKYALS